MTDDWQVIVKVVPKSRSLRLRVMPDASVVVTAPRFTPKFAIDRFVAENEEWINTKRSSIVTNLTALTAEREKLFYRGREYSFRLAVNSAKPGVAIQDDTLTVTAPDESHETVRQILEKWYRKEAEKHFKARVPLLADLVNRDVVTVSIRSQRTRWGSCSSRNTISLNWRLIMAPDTVSDYVVYHELAHLTHMNHSRAFWQLVEDYCPAYKTAEAWLKAHQQLLQF